MINRIILMFLYFLLLSTISYTQIGKYSYKQYILDSKRLDSVDFHLEKNEPDLAMEILNKVEVVKANIIVLLNNRALIEMQKGNIQKAHELIKESVLNGYHPSFCRRLFNEKDFNFDIDSLYKVHLGSLNLALVDEIKKMFIDDQSIRRIFDSIRLEKKKDQIDSLSIIIRNIDSINVQKLKKIIAKDGWPNYEKIGYCNLDTENTRDILPIIIHSNESDCLFFLSYLYNECTEGNEGWHKVENLFYTLKFRYSFLTGVVPIRFINSKDENLDILELNSILKYIKNYRSPFSKINLFPTNEFFKDDMKYLRNFLIKNGIDEDKIEEGNSIKNYEGEAGTPYPKILLSLI